ncbi:MAG: hypothetical protein WCG04_04420 [Alphaproteobacteria bacterium]
MALWNTHKEFSAEFLAQYHEYILYDTYAQIRALLLYPLNCRCEGDCRCTSLRSSIRLALNTELYNQAEAKQTSTEVLYVMRLLLKIPDDRFFRKHYADAYPLWLIEENFQQKVNHFKVVGQLVWTLLRLAKTYEVSFFKTSKASLKEAIEIIVGKMPLKSKPSEQTPHLCGEKAYGAHFRTYKEVSHFIAALQLMNKTSFTLTSSGQIAEFLSLAHWVREKLLVIQTPNVKDNVLLDEDDLVPLPPWVNSDNVRISLDPIAYKLRESQDLLRQSLAAQAS